MSLTNKRCSLSLSVVFLFCLLNHNSALANSKQLAEVYALYKKGAYSKAIEKLHRISGDQKTRATVAYWKGLCRAKTQEYDKAAINFERAEKLGSTAQGLYYELGQAHYANQRLEAAIRAFRKSVKANYKKGASAYYLGYLNQTLENYDRAIGYYDRLQKLKGDEDKVKQPALFQKAEILLLKSEKKDKEKAKRAVKEEVIPQLEKTIEYNEKTALAIQAKSRIRQLKRKYLNERPGSKPWGGRISQKFKYDSNVTTEADEALVQVSDKDSIITVTSLSGNYKFQFGKWRVTPSLVSTLDWHINRRTVSSVYQNDQLVTTFTPKVRRSHTFLGKKFQLQIDPELGYTVRDYTKTHTLRWYQRYFSLKVGERMNLWEIGATTVSVKYKMLTSQNPAFSANTPSLSLDQNFKLNQNYSLSVTVSADWQTAESDTNDLYTYKAVNALTIKNLIPEVTVRPSFSFTLYDTRNQSVTRGTEKGINPSIKFTKKFGRKISTHIDYAYTKRISLAKSTYQYTKHVVTLGGSYSL